MKMSEDKFNSLKKVHKIVLIAFIVINFICTIMFSVYVLNNKGVLDYNMRNAIYGAYAYSLCDMFAFICGYLYAKSDYSKQGAKWYKAFIGLTALSTLFHLHSLTHASGFGIPVYLLMASIVILLVLTFAPNLGKKNTWILFAVLFAIDLIYTPLVQIDNIDTTTAVISVLTRLVADGTIGLAIMGKYRDKDARGTI